MFPKRSVPAVFCLLLALLCFSVDGQTRRRAPRTKARTLPVAAKPFTFSTPEIQPATSGPAAFPAGGKATVPAFVLHGGKPGPVIAFLFHGFGSDDEFREAVQSMFGEVNLPALQGTVLALSFPARQLCEGLHPCPTFAVSSWNQISPAILDAARFVVDVHQGARGATQQPYSFVYLPNEDQRLATYVKAMARACLIPDVVELKESELEGIDSSAQALEHLAPQSIAVGHPAISIESPSLSGEAAARLRKGLANLLDHLKMTSGSVSWQNGVREHSVTSLPPEFFLPE